jgi:AcrR family transcriptional regulator
MSENQDRRRARRQRRGLLRAEAILHAAGALFAEVGYDKTTTNMIAARAGVSPGSLYQFFPNKEAIARAYAADAVAHLHRVYDALLAPPVITLPFPAFHETFIDALVDFNRQHPGYLALSIASTISPPLALALAELQHGVMSRLEAVVAALLPHRTPEQRRLPGLVSYRIFLALLPLVLQGHGEQQQAIVRELKVVLYRYWSPMVGAGDETDPLAPEAQASGEEGEHEGSKPRGKAASEQAGGVPAAARRAAEGER